MWFRGNCRLFKTKLPFIIRINNNFATVLPLKHCEKRKFVQDLT